MLLVDLENRDDQRHRVARFDRHGCRRDECSTGPEVHPTVGRNRFDDDRACMASDLLHALEDAPDTRRRDVERLGGLVGYFTRDREPPAEEL
jgi:hypothetical protein